MASFAAAAVVGGRNSRLGQARSQLPSRFPRSEPYGAAAASGGPNLATGLAAVVSAILLCAGITSLAHSVTNDRAEKVQAYDDRVEEWTSSAREDFQESWLHVSAHWLASAAPFAGSQGRDVSQLAEGNASYTMVETTAAERRFHDAEGSAGLLAYTPLRFQSTFHFDSYYPTNDTWELLAPRENASMVVFEFQFRSRNGTYSTFATQPWPLVYDTVVRPRSPAQDSKCRRENHGTWQNQRCHVVKRLNSVCVQIELNEAGEWRLNKKGPDVNASSAIAASTAASGAIAGAGSTSRHRGTASVGATGTHESYGCDPGTAWHPATYVTDACWGPYRYPSEECRQRRAGGAAGAAHEVLVTVRSARDPFLRAEELTDDKLDFGLSPSSQRVFGSAMLVIGLCLCLLPACWLIDKCRRKEHGDTVSLRRGDGIAGGVPMGDMQDDAEAREVDVYGRRAL